MSGIRASDRNGLTVRHSAGLVPPAQGRITLRNDINETKRELARIQCELTGHWHAEFKKKYDDKAHCPRCKDPIRVKATESDGPGLQYGEDTLHQRLVRLEAALGIEQ